uniref:Dual specificity protein phosphatase 15 n=1 Tax=Nothobranchius furzeri TaxID=105023 RepID=A0A8C6KEA3_NOTFU
CLPSVSVELPYMLLFFLLTDSENRESLSKNGITHILSVYNNATPVIEYLCIHAADTSSQNLLQHFKESIGFIHECRLNGGVCLVHCLAGVSRSTTMVVAYLMTVTHYSWEECLSAVKAVRSFVGPNYGFQQQLEEYQNTTVSEVNTMTATDSFYLNVQQAGLNTECFCIIF